MKLCAQCGVRSCSEKGELCDECLRQNIAEGERINRLYSDGHTLHCAKRQVWGDGLCECKWRKGSFVTSERREN